MEAKVVWIGIRPVRKEPVVSVERVYADKSKGLDGDHDVQPHRQVTLISSELLSRAAELLQRDTVDPSLTRGNIVVQGVDMKMAAGTQLSLGDSIIEITGPCLPCDRMEKNLGAGGRRALDTGGMTARILVSGTISVGDAVGVISTPEMQKKGMESATL